MWGQEREAGWGAGPGPLLLLDTAWPESRFRAAPVTVCIHVVEGPRPLPAAPRGTEGGGGSLLSPKGPQRVFYEENPDEKPAAWGMGGSV